METFTLHAETTPEGVRTVREIRVHDRVKCAGRGIPCVIHGPSDHHMRGWELNWRDDTGVMERICPHGIVHPDPDHMAYALSTGFAWQGVHGCDGCCNPPVVPGGPALP